MPRKQRFKPSRKPKPSPQSESQAIGHDARNASSHSVAHNDNIESPGGSPHKSDDSSSLHPETDPR